MGWWLCRVWIGLVLASRVEGQGSRVQVWGRDGGGDCGWGGRVSDCVWVWGGVMDVWVVGWRVGWRRVRVGGGVRCCGWGGGGWVGLGCSGVRGGGGWVRGVGGGRVEGGRWDGVGGVEVDVW